MSFDISELRVNEVKPNHTPKERQHIVRTILRENMLVELLGEDEPELIDTILEALDRIDDDEGDCSDSAVLELEPSFAKPSFEPSF
jgi:hypothetical protein